MVDLVMAITTFIGSYWTLERWATVWGMLANSATVINNTLLSKMAYDDAMNGCEYFAP